MPSPSRFARAGNLVLSGRSPANSLPRSVPSFANDPATFWSASAADWREQNSTLSPPFRPRSDVCPRRRAAGWIAKGCSSRTQQQADLHREVLVQKGDVNGLQRILQRQPLLCSQPGGTCPEAPAPSRYRDAPRRKPPRRSTRSLPQARSRKFALAVRELAGRGRHVIFRDLQEPIALVLAHRHVGVETLAVLERDERLRSAFRPCGPGCSSRMISYSPGVDAKHGDVGRHARA